MNGRLHRLDTVADSRVRRVRRGDPGLYAMTRAERQARLVRVAGAIAAGAALWLLITAAAVLAHVFVGLGCVGGLACLGW